MFSNEIIRLPDPVLPITLPCIVVTHNMHKVFEFLPFDGVLFFIFLSISIFVM